MFSLFIGATTPAFGHSAEQAFVLLLPTNVYITAGTLAVVATIVLVSLLDRKIPKWMLQPIETRIPSVQSNVVTSLLSTVFLFGIIWIGFTGPRDPLGNILPLTIWIIWWIGLVTCLGKLGDIWRHLNPWSGLYVVVIGDKKPPLCLPNWVGIWPAVIVFLAFHIFAIADTAPSDPFRLATIVTGYWIATFIGMLLFGASPWLERVECFTVFFRLIASLAPVQKSNLGMPGWATLRIENLGLSHAAFCILMLGAGSFDGLHETFWWLAKIGINPLEFPGRSAVVWTSTFGLIGTCLVLATAFVMAIWLGNIAAKDRSVSISKAIPIFALSLIPIAFGYHVAHYLTSFLVGIQYSAIALSDPFATGADFIGMSKLRVTTGFLNDPTLVKLIWFVQAAAVVISHIIAVMMAHAAASQLYQSSRHILLSQSALSILMIAYTVFGLWLLASPRGV